MGLSQSTCSVENQKLTEKIETAIKLNKKYDDCHEQLRVDVVGTKDHTTYNGSSWYWSMIFSAYQVVKEEFPNTHVEVINAKKTRYQMNDQFGFKEYGGIDNHPYIRVAEKNKEPIIIDVLLRTIFMLHRGSCKKWSSPYGNAIYTKVPMVFVGTYEDLEKLWDELIEIRSKDKLHLEYDDLLVVDNPLYYFNYNKQKNNLINEYGVSFHHIE